MMPETTQESEPLQHKRVAMEFTKFVGIDWSGSETYGRARNEHPIQVAQTNDVGCLELVSEPPQPRGRPRWRRTDIVNWLESVIREEAEPSCRTLVGLDFAFSFPYHDIERYFPACRRSLASWENLARAIHGEVGDDFKPMDFIRNKEYVSHFLFQGNKTSDYSPRIRITEDPAFLRGQKPASVFKLIGPDQVGRGSVAGIACLKELRLRLGRMMHIWPFDGLDIPAHVSAVFVEVWPRLLYERVGVPSRSHAYPLVFRLALQECGVANVADAKIVPRGENTGDALLTAAALRHFVDDEDIWSAPQRHASIWYRKEGWIWGADDR